MADTNPISLIGPLIQESSSSESTSVEVELNNLKDELLLIPDYQRDSDQWDRATKSIFIESVINNLPIPAFFFEVKFEDAVEKNDVIDGQQRLNTLSEFYINKFRMVDSDDAPYLSPQSVHYAGKTFDELPKAYQQAFKKYHLTVIKLRNLGDMRLEVFRRINRGGTPLSGQDIRLAYYGGKSKSPSSSSRDKELSPSLALVRLAGAYDPERPASKRFLASAQKAGIEYPWKNEFARKCWSEWWDDKAISRGQTASESFLWAIISAQFEKMDDILQNSSALQVLNCRFNGAIDEALDACCAQLRFQDLHKDATPALMPCSKMIESFFPAFEDWIGYVLGEKGINLPVSKHRSLSVAIGAAYGQSLDPSKLTDQQWTDFVEFIRRPQDIAQRFQIEYPQSKGRWGGIKGYRAQLQAVKTIIGRIVL